jgi:hypothetical protein
VAGRHDVRDQLVRVRAGAVSTPCTVTLSLYDSSFDVLASRSASITTKKPQQGTL